MLTVSTIARTGRLALAALAVTGAGVVASVGPAAPATAAPCNPWVAILPFSFQNRDLAQGGDGAPMADRDSSGISYAESWKIIKFHTTGDGETLMRLENRLKAPNGMTVTPGTVTGSPVAIAGTDATVDQIGFYMSGTNGIVRFRFPFQDRFLTYTPNSLSGPYKYLSPGQDGQLFKVKTLGC